MTNAVMPIFRDDAHLLTRFRRGERDALLRIYRFYADDVAQSLRRGFGLGTVPLQSADVVDLVQESFTKAFSPAGRAGFDGQRDYRPYLLALVRNVYVDWLRRHARMIVTAPEAMDALTGAAPPPVEPPLWERPDVMDRVKTFLATLPEELATVHRLRFVEGVSQDTAGRLMGKSRQNLRTLEDRLRRLLSEHLRDGAAEPAPEAVVRLAGWTLAPSKTGPHLP